MVVPLDNLCGSLKSYEQARESTQILPPRPTFKIGSPLSKENLFYHCYKESREHSNSLMRLLFRFEQNKKCVFSIKKFVRHGDKLILAEIWNIIHHQLYSLYKNRYLIGYKCGFYENKNDI